MLRFACLFILLGMILGSTLKAHSQQVNPFEFGGFVEDQVQRLLGDQQVPEDEFVFEDRDFAANGRGWGPEQATGAPDTPRAGDFQTAWASLTQDNRDEWLELTYTTAVVPTEVVIHESYNPGAVYKVTVIPEDGDEQVAWEGEDPTPKDEAMGVSKIKLDTDIEVRRIRVYLKSKEVKGWNEIDAVGLIGQDEELQWATEANASTTYAQLQLRPALAFNDPRQLIPTDEQVRELIEERERQLAKLIKKLREQRTEMNQLERTYAKEKRKLEDALKESTTANDRLRDEVARLREQLDALGQ